MKFDPKIGIDATDWTLLSLLQQDARASFAELGRKLKLSAPAIAERMKRLEDRGIIQGYKAEINISELGRPLQVYLRAVVQPRDYPRFRKKIQSLDDILECHHVTGTESFVLKAAVSDVKSLEELIQQLTGYGPTTTSVILSTTLERKQLITARQRS